MTGSAALRDLLTRMSDDQRRLFVTGGMLACGFSDTQIAKATGLPPNMVLGCRALVCQRATRPEVADMLLPDRETRQMGRPAVKEAEA